MEELPTRLVAALESFESAQRAYFPGIVPQLRGQLTPFQGELAKARKDLEADPAPPDTEPARKALLEASALCLDALAMATEADGLEEALVNFRKAGRKIHRAQEFLLPLCPVIPAVNRYFLEPQARSRASEFLPNPGLDPAKAFSMAAPMRTPTHGEPPRSTSRKTGTGRNRSPSSLRCTAASVTGGISSGHGSARREAVASRWPAPRPATSPGPSRVPTPTESC